MIPLMSAQERERILERQLQQNSEFKVTMNKLFISDNVGPRSSGIDLCVNTLKQAGIDTNCGDDAIFVARRRGAFHVASLRGPLMKRRRDLRGERRLLISLARRRRGAGALESRQLTFVFSPPPSCNISEEEQK